MADDVHGDLFPERCWQGGFINASSGRCRPLLRRPCILGCPGAAGTGCNTRSLAHPLTRLLTHSVQGRWGAFTSAEEVEALIDSLDRRGQRESALLEALNKRFHALAAAVKKAAQQEERERAERGEREWGGVEGGQGPDGAGVCGLYGEGQRVLCVWWSWCWWERKGKCLCRAHLSQVRCSRSRGCSPGAPGALLTASARAAAPAGLQASRLKRRPCPTSRCGGPPERPTRCVAVGGLVGAGEHMGGAAGCRRLRGCAGALHSGSV